MNQAIDVVLRAGLALISVTAFYSAAATRWPTSYYVLDDAIGSTVSATWWKYGAFRFLPLFFASICAMAYLPEWLHRAIVGLLIAIGSALISLWRINPITNPDPKHTPSWYVAQGVIITVSTVLVAVSTLVAPLLGNALPKWHDLTTALITAVMVVSVASMVISSTSKQRILSKDRVQTAAAPHQEMVESIALEHGIYRPLALALVTTEELQRPAWFRAFEYPLAKFGVSKTVGLGQSSGRWGVTNRATVSELVRNLTPPLDNEGRINRNKVAAIAESVNEGDGYVEFVLTVFDQLTKGCHESADIDTDGNPFIVADTPTLMRGQWDLSGDIGPSVQTLWAKNRAADITVEMTIEDTQAPSTRRAWSGRIPVEWTAVELTRDSPNESGIVLYPSVQLPS